MVKPIVTIAALILGALGLTFGIYVQAQSPSPAAAPIVFQDSATATATADPKPEGRKNDVFVVMIEPMFFMGGGMDSERVSDAPQVTPSRAELMTESPTDQCVLSAHRMREREMPCVY